MAGIKVSPTLPNLPPMTKLPDLTEYQKFYKILGAVWAKLEFIFRKNLQQEAFSRKAWVFKTGWLFCSRTLVDWLKVRIRVLMVRVAFSHSLNLQAAVFFFLCTGDRHYVPYTLLLIF
jgi:hypothetical protein